MKELILFITLILCIMTVIVWIGWIGAMVSGECDLNAMSANGDLTDCEQKGFDLLYELIGSTPTPGW